MTRHLCICQSCLWTATYLKDDNLRSEKCPVDCGHVELLEIK